MTFENIVSILLALLAFAMISERIVELLKKSVLPFIGRMFVIKSESRIQTSFWGTLAALNTRMADQPGFEEKREQIIIPLSVLVGIGVSGICWKEIEVFFKLLKTDVNPLIGSILAGILFSFGSKFWHDVLDLILAIKNIRRNRANANAAEFSSAPDWSTSLYKDEKALAEAVIHEEKETLMTQYPLALVELSPLLVRNPQGGYQYLVAAYFKEKRPSGFPDYFRVPGSNQWIPTKHIENLGLPNLQRSPGNMLRNKDIARYGSFGCVIELEDGRHFILTCAHVLSNTPNQITEQEAIDTIRVWIGGTTDILPVFKYCFGGPEGLDYALIGPLDNRYHNRIDADSRLRGACNVSAADEGHYFGIPLSRHGIILDYYSRMRAHYLPKQDIQLDDGSIQSLQHLIRIDRITEEGDSGSVMYDDQGHVIGIVVAADSKFTYLLSIEAVLGAINAGAKVVRELN